MTKPAILIAFATIASLNAVGCVAQDKYDATEGTAVTLEQRNRDLLQNLETVEDIAARRQARIDQLEAERAQKDQMINRLTGQVDTLRQQISAIEGRLTDIRFDALDPETDLALQELARQYPQLVTYDPARGMLQFSGDLTFPSGSAQVKPEAEQTLRELARVLQSSAAQGYEIRVVGHTDSQPITNPQTEQRHATNRHLSVHRAIGVYEVLTAAGVAKDRVEVCGWGEARPRVPNNPTGGTQANRRVEIYLVPSTAAGYETPTVRTGEPMPDVPPAQQPRPVQQDWPMK